jgi:hypothetical protein
MQTKFREDSRFLEMNQKLANDAKTDADILSNQLNHVAQQVHNQGQATQSANIAPKALATSVISAPATTSNPNLINSSPIEADPFESFRVSTSSNHLNATQPIPTAKPSTKRDIIGDQNEIDALLSANKPKKEISRPSSGKSDSVKSPPKSFAMAFSDIIDVDAEFSAAFSDIPSTTTASVTKPDVSFENAFFTSPDIAAPNSTKNAFDLDSPIVWNDSKEIKLSDEDLNSAFVVEADVAKLMEMGFSKGKFRFT